MKKQRRRWTDEERQIIAREIAAGSGWVPRVLALLPHRGETALRVYASAWGLTDGAKPKNPRPPKKGPTSIAPRTYEQRFPPSGKPASDRTPLFLADLFAGWRTP